MHDDIIIVHTHNIPTYSQELKLMQNHLYSSPRPLRSRYTFSFFRNLIDIVVLHYVIGLVDDRILILLGLWIDRLFGLG